MDWVINHFDALFLVAVAVLAILQKFRHARRDGSGGPSAEDPDQAARTRRIQEEIRRRILERRGWSGGSPPEEEMEATAPEEPGPPPVIETWRPVPAPAAEAGSPAAAVMAGAAVELERQRRMLQELENMPRTAGMEVMAGAVLLEAPAMRADEFGVRAELRTRDGLRRAIVLREILGPPLGLR